MQDHLLLKALRGEPVQRPPVWMMRQAGRYLASYMELRKKYDFFTRVQTPELACEITLQPVDQIGVDAAILFSDILVVPQAMGLEVELVEHKGPYLPKTVQTKADIAALEVDEAAERLHYVYDAIKLIKNALNNRVPLIGFAGAPFTILCYMVEGKGSKNFDSARQFCISKPVEAHSLLTKITQVTIDYLKRQVKAGADVVQVFDSWSGLLSPTDFNKFARPYLIQIADALSVHVPVILYPKGSWYALADLAKNSKAAALGVDWCISPKTARELTGGTITLQGNFDPAHLHLTPDQIREEVHQMIEDFGPQRYIANLGHGITPDVPVDHARAFVEAVKEYRIH
ncbi:uroporphyrinogen decarboxylase [Thermaurantimonas aggregans]|uniref:Uroporphyrinogen decarboxylase n=1 Tax=Thermaurantimonas aggregans TaxID=2173829 RepID=A0A401XHT3_9FLAO|nr:uroporphyrinogen decarboxylase [Thermaurantimonas aggregans]MCX8149444.1 uroporphyrinogen decarboxylase [Thermaurantimonas aggregans]GCD76569.1 uroporphyrinogen decarboxylase [Thermaurantimonas aggregans]